MTAPVASFSASGPLYGPYPYDLTRPLAFPASSKDPASEILRLDGVLSAQIPILALYDAYYEGEQAVQYMAPQMVRALRGRLAVLRLNWCRLGADAYENRLDVEGFRYPGSDSSDQEFQDAWQENDLDEQSQQGHLDSVALSRSYAIVGAPDSTDDAPIVTVESPFQVTAVRDPRRPRRVVSAFKRWAEIDGTRWSALYLPDESSVWTFEKGEWRMVSRDEHGLGTVPVVPFVNRPRTLRPDGTSEFHDVISIVDAAIKMGTDMMTAAEAHAIQRRWATGLKATDFANEDGSPMDTFTLALGAVWATESENAKFGQFSVADLANFHNSIKVLAQLASQQLALPPHYLAFNSENPTSADAIRSSEIQLVKRAERKQTYLGGSWEDVMRLVRAFQNGGKFDPAAKSLQTIWRDPSTPTIAQKADAVVKLTAARVIPMSFAREALGYTPLEIARMEQMDRQSSLAAQANALVDNFTVRTTPTPVEPAPVQ
jgi:hypothetical protein